VRFKGERAGEAKILEGLLSDRKRDCAQKLKSKTAIAVELNDKLLWGDCFLVLNFSLAFIALLEVALTLASAALSYSDQTIFKHRKSSLESRDSVIYKPEFQLSACKITAQR
jgi:hypothetical protein